MLRRLLIRDVRMPAVAAVAVAIAAGLLWPSSPLHAAPENLATLEIGAQAPDFSLPGVDGKTYRLGDFDEAQVLVVVFTCNHCPTAQAYEQRIIQLHEDFRDRGVALVAISPNDPKSVRLDELGYSDLNDSLEEMKIRAEARGFQFPYLYDGETQEASAAYGALATPHVFIFDKQRRLRYVGRIDDSESGDVQSADARSAIEALLAGQPVPVEKTKVFGCSTKWADKRESAREAVERWNAEEVELQTIDKAGVEKLVENDSEKLRLINVWATWCGPCVTELPELVTMHRMYRHRDFELVTLSMDKPDKRDKALQMLDERHVSATNYLFGSSDPYELIELLDPEWAGPLPHTMLVAPGGKVIYRHTGPFDPLELKRAIVDHLGRTY